VDVMLMFISQPNVHLARQLTCPQPVDNAVAESNNPPFIHTVKFYGGKTERKPQKNWARRA
jgi:hypothetical protein